MVTIAFSKPWDVRIPTLTRYLDKEYVDLFLTEGQLRLSSFAAFRKHSDEQRGDTTEGHASLQIETPNGQHAIAAMNGQEAYVLCASTVENKNLEANFGTESGFRILDSIRFAEAISAQIPGFVGGMQGLCSYRDSLLIRKSEPQSINPPESYSDPEEWAKDYDRFVGQQARESFFLKHSRYAHQCEYRFIWFSDGDEKTHIDISCPAAARYCQDISV